MDFSGTAGGKSSLNPNDRAALINNVKEQLAMANAQEILQQISEKCFKLCIQKPGSSLSSSEQKCLNYCMDRFFDATNIVSRAYASRLQKELANAR